MVMLILSNGFQGIPAELLTGSVLDLMWSACQFEVAVTGETRWCMLFSPEDVEILEYIEDLESYWRRVHST